MRDHPEHCSQAMMGGLWGSVKGKFADMADLVEKWYKNEAKHPPAELANDELFLKEMVWPRIKASKDLVQHDSYCCETWTDEETRPFPTQRMGFEFVGATYTDPDADLPDQPVDLLKKEEAPAACRKESNWKWG